MNKTASKVLKIIAIVLICILSALTLAIFGFKIFDSVRYDKFYSVAKREFAIKGLGEGYIPQGFEYYKEGDFFLCSGYMMNKNAPSRVYVIDKTGEGHYTELKKEDNTPYTSHVGGISYYKEFLYIANGKGVDVFSLTSILDKAVTATKKIGRVETFDVKNSFCTSADDGAGGKVLYVGSFHRDGSYDTDQKFHVTTPAGEVNKGTILAFALNDTAEFGIDTSALKAVYSIPSQVQGIAFTNDGKMLLSTSYGFAASKLHIHDLTRVKATAENAYAKATFGVDAPLYYLDSQTLLGTVEAPPMSEEITFADGKIWVMNESASNKYIFGKITTGSYVYSFVPVV